MQTEAIQDNYQLGSGDVTPSHVRVVVDIAFASPIFMYDATETMYRAHKTEDESLKREFRALIEQWRRETRFISPIARKVMNLAYLKIIRLGKQAIPLLLAELRDRPGHLFVALHVLSDEDPAHGKTTFDEAVAAWLKWGRERGYI